MIFIGLAVHFNSYAKYDFKLGLGNLNEYVGKIQTDDQGTLNLLSVNPVVIFSLDYEYTPKILFTPDIGFTFPKSDRDENTNRFSFYSTLNLKYKMNDIYLLTGMGLFFTSISGAGGEENLNNGNSVDSFPLPDKVVVARNLIMNFGLGYNINEDFDILVHSFIFNLESKDQRAFSIGTNIHFHFGEFN